MQNHSPVERSSFESSLGQALTHSLRVVGQLVGLALLLGGAYHAWSIAQFCLSCAQNPENLEEPVKQMSKVLALENGEVLVEGAHLRFGRILAGLSLIAWYGISAWIAVLLMGAGGKLVLGPISERREFLSAMREFLKALNREGNEAAKK